MRTLTVTRSPGDAVCDVGSREIVAPEACANAKARRQKGILIGCSSPGAARFRTAEYARTGVVCRDHAVMIRVAGITECSRGIARTSYQIDIVGVHGSIRVVIARQPDQDVTHRNPVR